MIVGVSSVLDEAGIIHQSATHLLNSGADWLIISDGGSTDRTRDILNSLAQVTVYDQIIPFRQDDEITMLSHLALGLGATWVVPFDADEFWCGCHLLNGISDRTGRVQATMWQHTTWERRHQSPKPLPKVAFRPVSGMRVAWGNHDVTNVPGDVEGGLIVRELQYRDWPHFVEKVEKARRLFQTSDFPVEYGSHMRRLAAMTDSELKTEWAIMQTVPTVWDPVPYRGEP